jgi:hypothetical protein
MDLFRSDGLANKRHSIARGKKVCHDGDAAHEQS